MVKDMWESMKSNTKWTLFLIIARNPQIKTHDLTERGFKAQTIRRYRKAYQNAEKELLGLKWSTVHDAIVIS